MFTARGSFTIAVYHPHEQTATGWTNGDYSQKQPLWALWPFFFVSVCMYICVYVYVYVCVYKSHTVYTCDAVT